MSEEALRRQVVTLRQHRTKLRRALSDMLLCQPDDDPEFCEPRVLDRWERANQRASKVMQETKPQRGPNSPTGDNT